MTVFEGTRIERFPVTVLGVAGKAIGGVDMILVRLENTALNRFGTGIVAGMSGSPIFVDGRMVGALAYGWAYSQTPIGGVTPLPAMFRPGPEEDQKTGRLDPPLTIAGRRYHSLVVGNTDQPGTLSMTPVNSILCTQGLGTQALAYLDGALEPLNLEPVAALSGTRVRASIPPMVPGAAVGVQLMSGDLEAAVTGTLTWREEDRILAFGHSMAGLGEVALPLTASYINAILPSYQRPFKMSSSLGIIGQFNNDGLYAVAGRVHAPAEMIPVSLEVEGPGRESIRRYQFKVAQDPRLTHSLIPGALVELLSSGLAPAQDHTALMEVSLDPAGDLPSLNLVTAAAGRSLDSRLAGQLHRQLSSLADNRYRPVKLSSLTARLTLRPGRRSATITGFTTDRTTYAPGDTIKVDVRLQNYGTDHIVTRSVSLAIPPDTPKGSFKIGVVGGAGLSDLHSKMGYRAPEPANLRLALEQLQQQPTGRDLVVAAALPVKEAQVNGQALPLLPSFLREMLEGANDSQAALSRSLYPVRLESDLIVEGMELADLKIEPRDTASEGNLLEDQKAPADKKSDPPSEIVKLPGPGKRWEVRSRDQFRQGVFEGAALDGLGQVVSAGAVHPIQQRSGAHPWIVNREGDRTLVGWSDGTISEIAPHPHTLTKLPDPLPLSVAQVGSQVWVGTGPWGGLVRLEANGTVRREHLPVAYVWDLEPGPGGMLAACGLPGRLYLVPPQGEPQLLWDSQTNHLTSLAAGPDGTVYMTASGGAVYKFEPGAPRPALVTTVPDPEPAQVEFFDGQLAVAAGNTLYLLDADKNLRTYRGQDGPLISLAISPDGTIWTGSARNGAIYKLVGDDWSRLTVAKAGGIPALSAGSRDLLACAHQSALSKVDLSHSPGRYTSPVLDTQQPSRWGTLRWSGSPFKTGLILRTRSGSTPEPDGTWSEWSAPLTIPRGEAIPSPAARYLQVQVDIPRGAALQSFDASFMPLESTPRARWATPLGGERWSGTQTAKWTLETGTGLGLDYRVLLASESGEWKELKPRAPVTLDAQEIKLPAEGRNGSHRLKLELYQVGADTPLQTLESKLFYLSDSPPSLSWLGGSRGLARRDDAIAIVAVEYRQAQGAWRLAQPVDGLFDSSREEFTIPLPAGSRVEIRAKDECGQTATLSRSID